MNLPVDSATQKLAAWQAAQHELTALEKRLGEAMWEYAQSRGDPPRELIIEVERKREEMRALFDIAMAALDAQSAIRTGHTNFGSFS